MKKFFMMSMIIAMVFTQVLVFAGEKTSYKEHKNGKITYHGGVVNQHNGKIALETKFNSSCVDLNLAVGDTYTMAGIEWTVIDTSNGFKLRGDLNESIAYDLTGSNKWETSNARKYLSGEFLDRFTSEELSRLQLMTTPIVNYVDGSSSEVSIDKVRLMNVTEAQGHVRNVDFWLLDHYYGHTGQKQMMTDGKIRNSYNYALEKGLSVIITIK